MRLVKVIVFLLSASVTANSQETEQDHQDQTESQKNGSVYPQGPLDPHAGNLIEWQDWAFRWQYRNVEGLVLTDVHFKNRKFLKSISLAEIYVPYATGLPRPEDFSLGGFVGNPFPLKLGIDCIPGGNVCKGFDIDGVASQGPLVDVMIHEERLNFLYAGAQGRAPAKMLVLWTMAHFPGVDDGYTYILRWKLRTDGVLTGEVGATGGLQHLNRGAGSGRGQIVGTDSESKPVFAPSHVHNYYFRIDFDIDGAESNTVEEFSYELDVADPMLAMVNWTPFTEERGRVRREDIFRSWRVVNRKSLNKLGNPRSYHLMPGGHGAWKDGYPMPILKGDFFVTKYHDDEFPYSNVDSRRTLAALETYLNGEDVTETDVVAWYRLSFVHHPRAEEYPLQPIVWHSFDLIPRDFLDASPLTIAD